MKTGVYVCGWLVHVPRGTHGNRSSKKNKALLSFFIYDLSVKKKQINIDHNPDIFINNFVFVSGNGWNDVINKNELSVSKVGEKLFISTVGG